MSKTVLISIQPKWCEMIAAGKKTVEVRKSRPKLDTPFKCYIYCTQGAPYLNRHNGRCYLEKQDVLGGRGTGLYERLSGKVIGEFVCDGIRTIMAEEFIVKEDALQAIDGTCLTIQSVKDYAGWKKGMRIFDCKDLFGWHISDLVIYDRPRELAEFTWLRKVKFGYEPVPASRAPQSWYYVEELKGGESE